jgi:hypothetical protein
VTYGPSPHHAVSVATSTDGQVAVLAAQNARGACLYVEDNEESPAGSNGGLPGASARSGDSYATALPATCDAGSLPAHLHWGGTWPG